MRRVKSMEGTTHAYKFVIQKPDYMTILKGFGHKYKDTFKMDTEEIELGYVSQIHLHHD